MYEEGEGDGMLVGGGKETVAAVKAAGRQAGPITTWEGAWIHRYGVGHVEERARAAKELGVPLVVLWWYWGDGVTPSAITNGAADQYNDNADGTPIWKSREKAYKAVDDMITALKAQGVIGTFVIELEHNKNGTEGSAPWLDYFSTVARKVKAAGHKVCWAPGIWGRDDETTVQRVDRLVQSDAALMPLVDVVGVRHLACVTRNSVETYRKSADTLLEMAEAFRRNPTSSGKEMGIVDFGVSTYGGAFNTSKPFKPIGWVDNPTSDAQKVENARLMAACGRAMDQDQENVFKRLLALQSRFDAAGATFIAVRSIEDNPGFNVANYFGYGERFWGVKRADGSLKPAYNNLIELSTPAEQPTPTVPKAEYDAVVEKLRLSEEERVAVAAALGAAVAKIERARDALV